MYSQIKEGRTDEALSMARTYYLDLTVGQGFRTAGKYQQALDFVAGLAGARPVYWLLIEFKP